MSWYIFSMRLWVRISKLMMKDKYKASPIGSQLFRTFFSLVLPSWVFAAVSCSSAISFFFPVPRVSFGTMSVVYRSMCSGVSFKEVNRFCWTSRIRATCRKNTTPTESCLQHSGERLNAALCNDTPVYVGPYRPRCARRNGIRVPPSFWTHRWSEGLPTLRGSWGLWCPTAQRHNPKTSDSYSQFFLNAFSPAVWNVFFFKL